MNKSTYSAFRGRFFNAVFPFPTANNGKTVGYFAFYLIFLQFLITFWISYLKSIQSLVISLNNALYLIKYKQNSEIFDSYLLVTGMLM